MISKRKWVWIALLAGAVSTSAPGFAAPRYVERGRERYVEGQIIVRFKANVSIDQAQSLLDARVFEVSRALVPALNIYLIKTRRSMPTSYAMDLLSHNPQIRYSQPDHYLIRREAVPNDPQFPQQWSLSNPSRTDISATHAWDLGTGGKDQGGNDLVVAVVDGGVDTHHQDLKDNIWVNKGEIPNNGIDDEGNGYIDDVNGWNAFNHSGHIPTDYHATHVAGIAGAKGNNGIGVTGINWNLKIMSVAAASATTSVIAEGYGYVLAQKKLWIQSHGAKGANIVSTNSSFGVDYADCKSRDFPVWNDLYDAMGKVGILSAVATANHNINVDERGDVPSGCSSSYLVTVTNTDRQDNRNPGAAYGAKTINLGAPGTNILSTLPHNQTGMLTGTSMATPHVAGAIAYLHSVASPDFYQLTQSNPAEAAMVLKTLLLQNVDEIPSLKGITTSNGRLNLYKAAVAISSYKRH